MKYSVSQIELYRGWKDREDADMDWLLKALTDPEPTPEMLRGRAFARALERLPEGDYPRIDVDGHTFAFTGDFEVPLWPRREFSGAKDYGGIIVTARCDRILGRTIQDDKTTVNFCRNASGLEGSERYIRKVQWRYYLDIFDADRFVWNVWEMKEIESHTFEVYAMHEVEQFRYPELENDCRDLALEFRDFAIGNLRPEPVPFHQSLDLGDDFVP